MKTLIIQTTLLLLAGTPPAFAADGAGSEGKLLLFLFLSFGALIIVFQCIPGLMMFVGLLKGLFGPRREEPAPAVEAGTDEE